MAVSAARRAWLKKNRWRFAEYNRRYRKRHGKRLREKLRLRSRAHYRANRERIAAQVKARRLKNLKKFRDRDRRYHRKHRAKRLAYKRAYSKRNRAKYRCYYRRYYQKHRHRLKTLRLRWNKTAKYRMWKRQYDKRPDRKRARLAHRSSNSGQRRAQMYGGRVASAGVLAFYKWAKTGSGVRCEYCRKRLPVGKRTVDHKIPLCRGGSHSVRNLAVACRSCNCRKHHRTPAEYRRFLLRIKSAKMPTRG